MTHLMNEMKAEARQKMEAAIEAKGARINYFTSAARVLADGRNLMCFCDPHSGAITWKLDGKRIAAAKVAA